MQQPPSGGCVLKPSEEIARNLLINAAAFGRLCVETSLLMAEAVIIPVQPPSGGCVLKPVDALITNFHLPAAAFGRLCVETTRLIRMVGNANRSRLRAVVC